MGLKFGGLPVRIRGIVTHSLSPYEQRPFQGAISKGIPNTLRRMNGSVWKWLPWAIITYAVYDWGEKEYVRSKRKDPKDYENDV